jgi:hypothetical protein
MKKVLVAVNGGLNRDGLITPARCRPLLVIPAQAGIQ